MAIYCISGKFGSDKVWQIYSYKVLARKSLANRYVDQSFLGTHNSAFLYFMRQDNKNLGVLSCFCINR